MSFLPKKCEDEYSTNSKIKKEDVQQLMEWVEKQAHMPKVSEYMLIQILFVSDYSIQRAKDLVETYYEYRHTAPELFHHNDTMRTFCSCDFWNAMYCFVIPKLTPDGQRLLYFSLKQYNPIYYNCDNSIKMWVKVLLTMIMEQGTCPGYSLIYDMKGYSIAHVAGINISTMKKYIIFSQEAIPLRVKSVHIINGHVITSKLEKFIRPFIKTELTKMVNIYSNMEDVYKILGKEYFPSDIGGTLPQSREELNENMKARINVLSPLVMEELSLKTDESNRLHKKFDDINSRMDSGSFRKLNID